MKNKTVFTIYSENKKIKSFCYDGKESESCHLLNCILLSEYGSNIHCYEVKDYTQKEFSCLYNAIKKGEKETNIWMVSHLQSERLFLKKLALLLLKKKISLFVSIRSNTKFIRIKTPCDI